MGGLSLRESPSLPAFTLAAFLDFELARSRGRCVSVLVRKVVGEARCANGITAYFLPDGFFSDRWKIGSKRDASPYTEGLGRNDQQIQTARTRHRVNMVTPSC